MHNDPHSLMGNYARTDLVFERGEGAWLIDDKGERYLDFASGLAVNVLGHAHPRLVDALKSQAERLWHTSNLYRVAGQENVAEVLCSATFADKVFFCNSGAEACEAAVKTARRAQFVAGHPERVRVITFAGAFHGRTLGMIAATGNAKYLEGFGPPAEGFDQVPLDDDEALQAAIGPETAAIMIEPIQGEGGVRSVPKAKLELIRRLCDQHGLLMILDEVQTGVGRTGHLFAHQSSSATPDIMAVAKGIGGGFPLGAILVTEAAAAGMTPGTHGSTFGGNPLAMAVAGEVLAAVLEPGFLQSVRDKSLRLRQELARLKDEFPNLIEEIRGEGLLLGVKLTCPVADVVEACIKNKLLLVGAGDNVVRLLPPLNADDQEIHEAITRLSSALGQVTGASP